MGWDQNGSGGVGKTGRRKAGDGNGREGGGMGTVEGKELVVRRSGGGDGGGGGEMLARI